MIGNITQPPVGDLTDLVTTAQTSAVAAINEVASEVMSARGVESSLLLRFDTMDTRIDNIVYGGVDLTDPLIFESGLEINDHLYVDTTQTFPGGGALTKPVHFDGTYTTLADGGTIRAVQASPVMVGTHDVATLAGFYAQSYFSGAGRLTHGWGLVGRFYKQGTGTIQQCAGVYSDFTVDEEGAIDAAYGFYQNPGDISAGAVYAAFQADLNEPTVSGTGSVYNNYGIRIGATTVGTNKNYGLYVELSAGTGIYNEGTLHNVGAALIEDDAVVVGDLTVADGDLRVISADAVGSDLITNGAFSSDTTGWTANNATLASVAGGQSGNGLEITRGDTSASQARQTITTVAGSRYRLTCYYKNGTASQAAIYVGTSAGGSQLASEAQSTAGTWTATSVDFTATTTTTHIALAMTNGATLGETMYFDTVTCVQLLGGNVAVNGKITSYSGTDGIAIDASGIATGDSRIVAEGGFRTAAITIADDTTVNLKTLFPNIIADGGILQISTRSYNNSAGLIHYRALSSPFCVVIAQPSTDIVVGTSALTDGTGDGTDAKLNIAATSSGELFVKNRRGASATFIVTVFC